MMMKTITISDEQCQTIKVSLRRHIKDLLVENKDDILPNDVADTISEIWEIISKVESLDVFTVTTTKKRTAKTDYEFYGIKCIVEANGYMEGRREWAGWTLPENGMTHYERTKRELLATMEAECQMLASDEGREDSLDPRYNGEL